MFEHPLRKAIASLLEEDKRYTFDAYIFVFEALNYAQNTLKMGVEAESEPLPVEGQSEQPSTASGAPDQHHEDTDAPRPAEKDHSAEPQRHVTGQDLCEAIRLFALEQFGYLSKTVLGDWGIHSTGDFGEIVFSLIRIGQMHKTASDRREDFDDVYDFDVAFRQEFTIAIEQTH